MELKYVYQSRDESAETFGQTFIEGIIEGDEGIVGREL